MKALSLLPLLVFFGCDGGKTTETGVNPDPDADTDTDTDADSDTDSDTDTDTDTDTDSDTDTDAVLTDVVFEVSASSITTRETAIFTATGTYDDGSEGDVTAGATFVSSDESVLKFYDAGVGQPLWAGTATVTATYDAYTTDVPVTVTLALAGAGDFVFNEILADGLVDGDPNEDGSTASTEDEFVEIANYADVTLDLSGATLTETDFPSLPRHTFAEGTVLRAGEAIVVFGGGDVSNMAGSNVQFVVAVNEDPGLEYGLSLLDGGETMNLLAADGSTITTFTYGDEAIPAISDASYVLDPDVWGTSYTHHYYAASSVGYFSPGTYTDGSVFPGADGRYGP